MGVQKEWDLYSKLVLEALVHAACVRLVVVIRAAHRENRLYCSGQVLEPGFGVEDDLRAIDGRQRRQTDSAPHSKAQSLAKATVVRRTSLYPLSSRNPFGASCCCCLIIASSSSGFQAHKKSPISQEHQEVFCMTSHC